MTGFGHGELVSEDFRITVEMKAVNHRYCDVNIKMPKKLNFIEADIRNTLKKTIKRGKVDVFINYQDTASESETVTVNEGLVKAYSDAAAKISDVSGRPDDLVVARLASYPVWTAPA